MIRTLIVLAALAGLPAIAPAGGAVADPVATINPLCPIILKPVEAGFTDIYRGQVIGFCCKDCRKTWLALNVETKDMLLARIGIRLSAS